MRAAESKSSAGSAPTKSKLVTERRAAARRPFSSGRAGYGARPRRFVGYAESVAATRTIELVTEIPGPRSREIGERLERAVASPLQVTFPIVAASGARGDADRRRRQHVHRLHRRRRQLNVGHAHPEVAGRGARAARSLRPHRLHDRPVRAVRRARRAARRARRRSPAG